MRESAAGISEGNAILPAPTFLTHGDIHMSNLQEHIALVIQAIDANLGEGYARKNPDLIGRMMQGDMMTTAATMIQDGLYFLGAEELDEEPFKM